jgi:hypothetical protein
MFALDWLTGFRGKDLNNFPIGSSDLRLLFAYLASPNISYKLHVYRTEGGVRQAGKRPLTFSGHSFNIGPYGKKCFKIFSSETSNPI